MESLSFLLQPHIGSDETLKGDTFGGLVVCGCYMDDPKTFATLGIKDSKLIPTQHIMQLGKQLLDTFSRHFVVASLYPEEYNAQLTTQNQTRLLNSLHKRVATELQERFGRVPHLVDEFPGCTVGDAREKRAESISSAVAAASIVARYIGLLQFQELSRRAGFALPLGSTHVAQALSQIIASGKSPSLFVKLHFKNVQLALQQAGKGQKTLRDGF